MYVDVAYRLCNTRHASYAGLTDMNNGGWSEIYMHGQRNQPHDIIKYIVVAAAMTKRETEKGRERERKNSQHD